MTTSDYPRRRTRIGVLLGASASVAPLGAIALGAALACSGRIGALGGDDGPVTRQADPSDPASGGAGGASAPPVIGSPERPDGYGETVDPLVVGFQCDDRQDPSIAPLHRLSVTEYENTLRDLLTREGAGSAFEAARDAVAQLPIDGQEDQSFSVMDGRLSQRHVDGYFNVADQVSTHIALDPVRLAGVAGDCATSSTVDAACLDAFIESFGAQVFRRPLSPDEMRRYAELNDGTEASEVYRGVVFTLLMAPEFLYHMETSGSEIDGRAEYLTLDSWELASRLSYHFWQTMPDTELFDAAASGAFETEDGFREQVERLFDDPRTEATVQRFYSEWYHLSTFGGFATTPAFQTFSSGVAADDALYDAAVREMESLIDYFVFGPGAGSYRDILTTDLVFTDSPELAALYGSQTWDGISPPPSLPEGTRSGLLTRLATLVSANHGTNPFKRGAFVRRELLCVPIHPPADLPQGALSPPPFDPNASTRERFAQKVEPSECAGCHATFMPFGFALEAYDGLGRFRTEETLIDDAGNIVGQVPIDATATVEIVPGQPVSVDGPVEMSQAIADSGLADECFARHYFRYTFRRNESVGDECALGAILERALDESGGGLRRAMLDVAMQDSFKRRMVE